jgi:CotS family spore coat protein
VDTTFSSVVRKVMSHYALDVRQIYLLSYKGKKAVWSVETDLGEVIVKKVPFDEEHIEFMIHAIDYLRERGVNTPAVYKNYSGKGWVKVDDEYFVIFEAVYGRSPEYEIEPELFMIMRGMAAFHKASRGIESPTGEFPSFLLTEWKEEMTARHKRLENWKAERTAAATDKEFDRVFLKHVDTFLAYCQASTELLERTGFDQWVEETIATKTLCHQDYASGNLAITGDGKLFVYDMDSLTVDVPLRDMRKILNKVMKKETEWDLERMLKMLKAYQEVNPLTKDQYRMLAADLLFPHLFYGQVSKYYEGREQKWTEQKHNARLKDMIATELSKAGVIQAFLTRIDEVVGDG